MAKIWKFTFDIKMDDGGTNAGAWDIRAWTAGEAIRKVVDIMKKTGRDEKAKKIKGLTFSLTRKDG